MFKLPTCPYCNTVYYYGEVVKSTKNKSMECYHCKKKFKVNKWKGRLMFYTVFIIVIGLIDFLMLCFADMKTAKPVIAFTVISVALSLLILPFTVRYKAIYHTNKK